MINKIAFKNYKIFKEKQTIEIKPITVLIGKNNSGKSAVAKLPTLIEGALNAGATEPLNVVNGDVELGAELRDLVYGKANRVIELELEDLADDGSTSKLSVGIFISVDKVKQSPKIDFLRVDNKIDLHILDDIYYQDEIANEKRQCTFNGLNPVFISEKVGTTEHILRNNFKLKTDFIGPIRVKPNRDYRLLSTAKNEKYGFDGENAYQQLIEDALTSDKKLITQVSKWYKDNFEGWELKINQDKAPIFQIEIHRNDLKQNLLDTGIGMGQVLPIVTRLIQSCDEETLIIVEEPETHLHPAAHGNLASLFVETLVQGNKKYLIETHSLNFVLRLRRLVAEGKLEKEDLAIYYVDFSEENNYSIISEIEVDDFGQVSEWPEGVFNETLDETIGIRTAQLDNKKYVR